MDTNNLKIGELVHWKWGNGLAKGVIVAISPKRTEIISKGKLIARNGSLKNPAVIIKHKNGNDVIKLTSELLTELN